VKQVGSSEESVCKDVIEELSNVFNILRSDESVIISGIALAEGTWRDKFYHRDEIKKSEGSLLGKVINVEHGNDPTWGNTIVGEVIYEQWDETLKALLFKAKITDKQMAQEIANGYWKAVSVRVKRDLEIHDGKLSCLNLRYVDLTLTKTPACKVCQVTSVSVDKLHLYKEKESLLKDSNSDNAGDREMIEDLAKWSTAYMNSLPNSSFAVVEGNYGTDECKNKNARHLPYKDANGVIDLPHLRNALARVNQIKPVCGPETAAELQAKASKKLSSAAKAKGVGKEKKETTKLSDEKDSVLNKILGILGESGSDTEKMQKVKDVAVVAKLQSMDTTQLISHFSDEVTALRKEVADLKSAKPEDPPEVGDPKTKTPCDKDKEKKGEEIMSEDPKPKDDEPKKTEEPKKDEDPEKKDDKETKKDDKPEDIKEDKDKKPEEPPKKEEVKKEEKKEEDEKEKIPTIEEIIESKEKSPDKLADLAVKLFFEHTKRQSSE